MNLLHSQCRSGIEKKITKDLRNTPRELNDFRIIKKTSSSLCKSPNRFALQIAMFLVLLFGGVEARAQNGYLNFHFKSLSELGSASHTFTVTGPNGYSNTFTLSDAPNQRSIKDIGASASGRLYAITDAGAVFYRDVTTAPSSWTNTGITGASRVDGGKGMNAWVVLDNGNVVKYTGASAVANASTTTVYTYTSGTNWPAMDVAFASDYVVEDNGLFVLRQNGQAFRYNNGSWLEYDFGTTLSTTSSDALKNIDCTSGGTLYATSRTTVYSKLGNTGTTTNRGNPATDIQDIAVAGTAGEVYISNSNNSGVKKYSSGTTWSAFEPESYGITRMTGGIGMQLWGIYRLGETDFGNIFSRAYNIIDGKILWIDDERVRPVSENFYGNTRFLPLSSGNYTITHTPPTGYETQLITVFNPTFGATSTTNAQNRTATLTIAPGGSTNLIWQSGLTNPFTMTTNCTTKYLETFGTGTSGSYAEAVRGQTSYHYKETAGDILDGQYRLITRGSDFGSFTTGLSADHTVDAGGATGYMYAVNASFDKGEFFRRRFTNVIPGARYKFAAWIASASNATIKPNVSFKVYDAVTKDLLQEYSTGNINTAFVWNEYMLEFTATSGAIDLVLENNNVGGNGNDLVLDDISFEITSPGAITASTTGVACGSTTGSLTITAPLSVSGGTVEYSLENGPWQTSTTFSGLQGGDYNVKARYQGSTGCVVEQNTISVPTSICGTIYNDANGLTDNTVNGTGIGTAGSTQLYAAVFDGTGSGAPFLGYATVASNGTFSFPGVKANSNYTVTVTSTLPSASNTPTAGAAASTQIPSGWKNVGEYVGTGTGNDGTPNGSINVSVLQAPLNNVKLGIEQTPTAGNGSATISNQNGSVQVTVPPTSFTSTNPSTDPSPGNITSIRITAIPTGATSISINGTTYGPGFTAFPAGGVTVPTSSTGQPTQVITVDPTANGNTTVTIPFVAIDNAGVESINTGQQGTAVLNLTAPVTVSGQVWNDADGSASKNGTEDFTNAGGILYANLVNPATGAVLQTVAVNAASGSYDFTNVPASANYNVILTTTNTATNLTASTLPAGWVNTGVNTNNTANTTNKTGIIPVTVGTTTVNGLNFGIEQTPTAGNGSATISNQNGNVQIAVPPSTFNNVVASSDPSPGIVSSIIITSLPTGVSSMVINGITYGSGGTAFPSAGVTVPTTSTGEPTQIITIDPTSDGATSVSIPFVAVDNANVRSNNTGQAVINFSTPLPVSLLSFDAVKNGKSVDLKWITVSENNNKGFFIERSADSKAWTSLGFVNSKSGNGNTTSKMSYDFKDVNPLVGKNFYRLKQVDFDGAEELSDVRFVAFEGINNYTVYPNPAQDYVIVEGLNGNESIMLYDVGGKCLYTGDVNNKSHILSTANLISGYYNLVVLSKEGKATKFKLIVNK